MELQQAVNVELLTTTRDGSNVVPLELLSDEDGVIADALIVRDGFRHRPRRAIAFALRAPEGGCVVVEAETIFPLMYPIQTTEETTIDVNAVFDAAFSYCATDFMHAQTRAAIDPWKRAPMGDGSFQAMELRTYTAARRTHLARANYATKGLQEKPKVRSCQSEIKDDLVQKVTNPHLPSTFSTMKLMLFHHF